MNFILLTVLCVLGHLTYGQNCEKCMTTNDAYCLNKSSYYFCMDGKPLTATLYTCKDGYICTDSENICEPKVQSDGTATVPVCSTSCNRCPEKTAPNMRYTCVSKNQFGRCVNQTVASVGACEGDTLCNSELYATTGKICAPACVIDSFGFSNTCSNDDTTTSTTLAPSTTPNVQNLKNQCEAAQITNQKYFYISNNNDADCKTYIYCEIVDGEMEALLIKCSSGYYFDSTTSQCLDTKPADCGITTMTTSTATTTTTSNPAVTTTTSNPSATATTTSNPAATTTTTSNPAVSTTTASNPAVSATTTRNPAVTLTTSNPAATTTTTSNPAVTTTTTRTP